MDKANIIISIIIVLCIAAAVTAYGITNTSNPIFSNLNSMSADDAGSGIGNHTTVGNNTGSVATTAGTSNSGSSNSGSSSSGSSSGSSEGSSSSGSSSSGSSSSDNGGNSNSDDGGNSNNDDGTPTTQLSYSDAQAIVSDAILEDGCYAGDGYYSDGLWYFTVYDQDGNVVDTITVDDATGATGRG